MDSVSLGKNFQGDCLTNLAHDFTILELKKTITYLGVFLCLCEYILGDQLVSSSSHWKDKNIEEDSIIKITLPHKENKT